MKRSLYRNFLVLLGTFIGIQFILLINWHIDASKSFAAENVLIEHSKQSTREAVGWMCSRFPRGTLPAAAWRQLRPQLREALRHPIDDQDLHGNWTADLLDLLSPHVLQYTVKGYPEFEILRSVMEKLSRRIRYLLTSTANDASNAVPPPLKIVVFGGSIVEGTGCMRSPIPVGKLDFGSLQDCAWPFRLEHALNSILDYLFTKPGSNRSNNDSNDRKRKWIQVYNLAAGGTHSEAAIPVLRYWLSPVMEPHGPDIIVNAYSANDNLPPAFHATTNTTIDSFHQARILQRNMQFVQEARFSNQHEQECHASVSASRFPMVLYVNDYLGNQQESIIGEGHLDQATQWLADMEPTMGYVSVSHAVRRWVFADTSEEFFSAPWIDRKGRSTINVHYGMAGHVTTTIGLLYYFMQAAMDFCEEAAAWPRSSNSVKAWIFPEEYLRIEIPSKPWVEEHHPATIRPNLTEWSWKGEGRKNPRDSKGSNCHEVPSADGMTKVQSPCAFAFLSAPLGTHQRQDLLEAFLEPFTLQKHGWAVQNDFRQGGFQNKLGLVALQPGATMTLGLPSQDASRVRVVTVHYLKSYGELWQGSRVEFRAQVVAAGDGSQVTHEQVWELEGFHEQAVSISYFHSVKLHHAIPTGGSFRLLLKLIGGKTFKINALMFCSR